MKPVLAWLQDQNQDDDNKLCKYIINVLSRRLFLQMNKNIFSLHFIC